MSKYISDHLIYILRSKILKKHFMVIFSCLRNHVWWIQFCLLNNSFTWRKYLLYKCTICFFILCMCISYLNIYVSFPYYVVLQTWVTSLRIVIYGLTIIEINLFLGTCFLDLAVMNCYPLLFIFYYRNGQIKRTFYARPKYSRPQAQFIY